MSATAAPARSRWIPWAFVSAFLVVFAANATMVTFALTSWTGLDTEDPYRRGVAYNRTLEAERRQATLGWRASASWDAGRLAVRVVDAAARPVTGAAVRADFIRPTAEGHDFSVDLAEEGGGRYAVAAEPPLAGLWDVRAFVRRGQDIYQLNQRIVVSQ